MTSLLSGRCWFVTLCCLASLLHRTGQRLVNMTSGAEDLMSIGDHCSHPECGQRDFLPFQCDCCKAVFCLEHRAYASHACAVAQGKDTQVIICPICAKAIKLQADQNVHEAFDAHGRTSCDPSNYAKVHQKQRCAQNLNVTPRLLRPSCRWLIAMRFVAEYTTCYLSLLLRRRYSDALCHGASKQSLARPSLACRCPAPGCKAKLREVNSYRCKQCGVIVCLAHRLEMDHACKGKPLCSFHDAVPSLVRADY